MIKWISILKKVTISNIDMNIMPPQTTQSNLDYYKRNTNSDSLKSMMNNPDLKNALDSYYYNSRN